jgi:hypothetical protein
MGGEMVFGARAKLENRIERGTHRSHAEVGAAMILSCQCDGIDIVGGASGF